ncbi:MAG: MATE family efflux transporter [Lachnospiraceae bacterium]|nr:MATE family efflux transporter [Lachnospiraceae bacterium]
MKIKLSEHFTYSKLLRFVFPSIVMMIFTSIYGVVDGIFVSNYVGKTPFAAINLIMPFLMLFGAVGFMFGTGGSALVAVTLGEGKRERANELFSMMIYITIISGLIFSFIGLILLEPIAVWLGAEGEMLNNCVLYGKFLLPALAPFMVQNVFQSFFVTAEKPHLGLAVTVVAGVTNIVLDALFVAVLSWGLVGAAVATAISQITGAVIPLIYFGLPNKSLLRLTKARFDGKAFLKACTNGSSELMSNLSLSLVNMLYNFQLIRFAGENGVAAYGVIMYVNFIFIGVFFGYAVGSAPVIGYHYGAGNQEELQNLFRKSIRIIMAISIVMMLGAEVLAKPLSMIFVSYDAKLLAMTVRGFMIYSVSFLFMGFNIFGSSFFTALNNGLISALISFLRALLFQVAALLLLPIFLELDGIWWAISVAELLALVVTIVCFVKMRKRYYY